MGQTPQPQTTPPPPPPQQPLQPQQQAVEAQGGGLGGGEIAGICSKSNVQNFMLSYVTSILVFFC